MFGMKTLIEVENLLFGIMHIYSQTIVGNSNKYIAVFDIVGNTDKWSFIFFAVFYGIMKKVVKNVLKISLCPNKRQGRKLRNIDDCPGFIYVIF